MKNPAIAPRARGSIACLSFGANLNFTMRLFRRARLKTSRVENIPICPLQEQAYCPVEALSPGEMGPVAPPSNIQGDMLIARSLRLGSLPILSIPADRTHDLRGGQIACSRQAQYIPPSGRRGIRRAEPTRRKDILARAFSNSAPVQGPNQSNFKKTCMKSRSRFRACLGRRKIATRYSSTHFRALSRLWVSVARRPRLMNFRPTGTDAPSRQKRIRRFTPAP